MRRNLIAGAAGILVLVLFLAAAVIISKEDRTGPEITVTVPGGQEIVYKSGEDRENLLKYAKATDRKDGDVSDTLAIEDIYVSADLTSANVIYVARDRSNNITKYSQAVRYIPAEGETAVSQPEQTTAETDSKEEMSQTGQSVTANEDNSDRPVLTLSQNSVSIKQGENFNPVSYIKDITDKKDDKNALYRRVIVNGSYSTSKPGDYTITIYCTNTEGVKSNSATLNLHVEKKEGSNTGKKEPDATKSEGASSDSETQPASTEAPKTETPSETTSKDPGNESSQGEEGEKAQ